MKKLIATGFLACMIQGTAFAETAEGFKESYKGAFRQITFDNEKCKDLFSKNEFMLNLYKIDEEGKRVVAEFSSSDQSCMNDRTFVLESGGGGEGSFRGAYAGTSVKGILGEIVLLDVQIDHAEFGCSAFAQFKAYPSE